MFSLHLYIPPPWGSQFFPGTCFAENCAVLAFSKGQSSRRVRKQPKGHQVPPPLRKNPLHSIKFSPRCHRPAPAKLRDCTFFSPSRPMTLRGSFSGRGAQRTTMEGSERNAAARFAANPGLGCDTTGTLGATLSGFQREAAHVHAHVHVDPGRSSHGGRFRRQTGGRVGSWGRRRKGRGACTLDLVKPANPEKGEGMGRGAELQGAA